MEEKKDTLELDLTGLDGIEPAPSRMTQEYQDFLKSQENLVVFDHIPGVTDAATDETPDMKLTPEEPETETAVPVEEPGSEQVQTDDMQNGAETDETTETTPSYTDDYYESWE